jgi:hypothetical protein
MNSTRMVEIYKGNGLPIKAKKVNRNQPCQCGSGKKAKNCCGAGTKYFITESKKEETSNEPAV